MYQLIESWGLLPAGFFSTSSRMVLSALFSLLFVLFLGNGYIRLLWNLKIGQPIREGKEYYAKLAELHKEKKNTPTMGGILFLGATFLSTLLWADWTSLFVRILVSSLFFFTIMGALDDWSKLKKKSSSGLRARTRFLLQSAWSLLLIAIMAFPDFFSCLGTTLPKVSIDGGSLSWNEWNRALFFPIAGGVIFTSVLGWLFMRLVEWGCLVGTPNAVNLTDGLDGLASGLAVLASLTLALLAFFSNHTELSAHHGLPYIESSGEIAVILCSLTGALLGFLWFNCHPAQMFMGDTGSLGIGALLGTAAFLLHQEWFLFFVGIVFVAEAISVILQVGSCKLFKRKIFRCTPLHHHFEYAGLHEMKVVLRFWIIGLLASAFAILTLVL
jgi:phospho-N-acetylmuramoyl-pentapeptide-transferase